MFFFANVDQGLVEYSHCICISEYVILLKLVLPRGTSEIITVQHLELEVHSKSEFRRLGSYIFSYKSHS